MFSYKMVDTRIEMIFNAIDAARSDLYRAIQATKTNSQDDYVKQFLVDAKKSMSEADKLLREMEIHINRLKNSETEE